MDNDNTARVLGGTQQVVAGMLYHLKVAITRKDGECHVYDIKVGAQEWLDPPFSIFNTERTNESC